MQKEGIYFLPLGGADEIGMNMYAYSVNGKWIVVDTGYGFLNDDYPGMDMCYASPAFLEEIKDKIEGIFITHAHEDHMGAIAQVWPSLQAPVYATAFAACLIKSRLKEYKMENLVPIKEVKPGDVVDLAEFRVEFVPLVHSVPETCGLFIKTAYGNIFHATDWRFDDGRLDMLPTGMDSLKRAGKEGVMMFVCDSTNVMLDKIQASEAKIRKNLEELIPGIKGGLIVTCFASNLMRLESLVLAAPKAGRTPILLGKSLWTNIKAAKECGYFADLPPVYTPEEVQGITSDKALYICTGSQANYRSALSVIAKGESKYVKLGPDDTIIFSSKIIPGNEEKIEKMQEKMIDLGVKVITEETAAVHTSGHPSKEELKKMYKLLKPQIVFPVHGDKRFIREHKRFALKCGVKEVCSGQNGDLFWLKDGNIMKEEEVFSDIMGVDRGRQVSLSSDLIKNRRRIAYNCSLFVSCIISADNKVADLEISSIDILEEKDWEILSQEIKETVIPLIEARLSEHGGLDNSTKDFIRGQIRKRVYKATDIKPVTFFHIYQEKKYNDENKEEEQCQ